MLVQVADLVVEKVNYPPLSTFKKGGAKPLQFISIYPALKRSKGNFREA